MVRWYEGISILSNFFTNLSKALLLFDVINFISNFKIINILDKILHLFYLFIFNYEQCFLIDVCISIKI